MTSLARLRSKLLTDPEVKAEYDRLGPIYAVVGEMIEARQEAGLTQAEVAQRMGTTQSVVARLESARHMPTFDMVARYAAALGRRLDSTWFRPEDGSVGGVSLPPSRSSWSGRHFREKLPGLDFRDTSGVDVKPGSDSVLKQPLTEKLLNQSGIVRG